MTYNHTIFTKAIPYKSWKKCFQNLNIMSSKKFIIVNHEWCSSVLMSKPDLENFNLLLNLNNLLYNIYHTCPRLLLSELKQLCQGTDSILTIHKCFPSCLAILAFQVFHLGYISTLEKFVKIFDCAALFWAFLTFSLF